MDNTIIESKKIYCTTFLDLPSLLEKYSTPKPHRTAMIAGNKDILKKGVTTNITEIIAVINPRIINAFLILIF